MAAQGFLLLASYLLVLLVLARPLGMCLARMVNDIPLPGLAGVERILWRVAGIRAEEMCSSSPRQNGSVMQEPDRSQGLPSMARHETGISSPSAAWRCLPC